MARTKGTYSLPANIEVLAGAPLDARDRVATKADLTASGTFPYPYVGMETFVVSEGKKYVLTADDPTQEANWSEVGSGGGAVEGYYNTTDGLFYKESTYTTAIPGAASTLYIDLATNKIYRYNGSTFILTPALGLTIAADSGTSALDLASGTKYKITVGPDTFIFKTPNDEKVTCEEVDPDSDTAYAFTVVPFSTKTTNQKPKINNYLYTYVKKGTASDVGSVRLRLGNDTPSGTAGNKYGELLMYSQKSGYVRLNATASSTTGRDIYFPDKAGTVALTSDITDEKVTGQVQNPTSGTTYNIPFIGTTNQKPYYNNGIQYTTLEGTASDRGYSQLVLGNSTSTGTAGNKRGSLVLYSEKNGNVTLRATGTSTNGRDIYFPDKDGTVALTSDLTTYTFASGTNGFTVTPSGGSAQTVTVTPSITNNVTGSGTSGYLAKFNGANTITNGPAIGTSTTTFLRNDGTWQTPSDTKVSQSSSTTSNWRKVLLHYTDQSASDAAVQSVTNVVYGAVGVSARPSDGTLRIAGNLWAGGNVSIGSNASNTSGARMTFDSTTNSVNFVFAS